MIKDDYTIPFLSEEAKSKLDRIVNLKEPNVEKGLYRSNPSKMSHKTPMMPPSPSKPGEYRFVDTQTSVNLHDQSLYTARGDENEYHDQSLNLQFTTDSKYQNDTFTNFEESKMTGKISRETLNNSFIQESTLDDVLMPPISLLERKYNNMSKFNYKKAQRDISFPMNPAFISDPKFNKMPPLEDLITF